MAVEIGLPAGVLNVVPGHGHIAGKAIGIHDGVDAINFTGSTEVGRHFLRYAADSNLKEVSLECGGKNPALILPDVTSLNRFAETLATGFMMNSGQLCSSISRVLVPQALSSDLRDLLATQMRQWPIGNPLDHSTRIGPLINAEHAAKVSSAFRTAQSQNKDFLISDAPLTGSSDLIVPPSVFFDVETSSDAWREEIFGPLLSVRSYQTMEEAITSANDTQYGLSAYIFSDSPALINHVANQIDAGCIAVNAFGEGDFSTPFGGFKLSGFGGKDKGIHAIDQYSRTKTIWWETGVPDKSFMPVAQ